MYSLFSKKENAHEDSIWSCAWARAVVSEREDHDGDPDHEKEKPPVETVDVLATGGVDDTVKVWHYDDGEVKLRHKLGDHSLGVVSVALDKDAKCKCTST